ncbi:MAG TPA: multidrug efflux SMR transporter [Pirellulales bacterium]|jgi:small multidrug resistance pump|nr:multidrug efflux SMR transporter [Pirellulales bacterium]
MSWLYLGLAILLEICGTTCLKLSAGFTQRVYGGLVFAFYGLSFWSLGLALKQIEVSTAYAIWSGAGTALIAAIGIVWFKEPVTAIKIFSIGLIVLGVVGLQLSGGH